MYIDIHIHITARYLIHFNTTFYGSLSTSSLYVEVITFLEHIYVLRTSVCMILVHRKCAPPAHCAGFKMS